MKLLYLTCFFRITSPSNCFTVLVGEKYLVKFDDVVKRVEDVTNGLATNQKTIYFAETSDVDLKMKENHLFVVRLQIWRD